ncbi:MAG TPA: hypothetical protein DCZ88_08070 [Pseudanabaena sp.]|nr:hypothetical protein [Pseudanabaena sp.]
MIKTLIATGFSCLAIGSIIGYVISELTKQPVAIAQTAPGPVVTSTPAKPKLNRQELEDRYIKAVNAFNFRVDKADLISLTDDQLNNEVYRLESLLRAGKAYTKP